MKALILHGWWATSQSHWFQWLGDGLKKKGYEVHIPDLPWTNLPDIQRQYEFIRSVVEEFGNEDIIVGHSMGWQLAAYAVSHCEVKIKQLMLVAPTYSGLEKILLLEDLSESDREIIHSYYREGEIKSLRVHESHVLLSYDDPYIDLKDVRWYYDQFKNVTVHEYEKAWHFNTDSGYVEFDELLKLISP